MKNHLPIALLLLLVPLCMPALAQGQATRSAPSASASGAVSPARPAAPGADDATLRARFVATAEHDIDRGKAKVADLEAKSSALSTAARLRADRQIATLGRDVKVAETRLAEMKAAAVNRWRGFEAGVTLAIARLRKAIEVATG